MGGPGPGGDPTQGIWSPAGGWYADPKRWRRNTALCFLASLTVIVPVFMLSAQREVHHGYPHKPIPSQIWCKNFPPKPQESDSSSGVKDLTEVLGEPS